MPIYSAPVKETLFVLNEVLNLENHQNLKGFEELSPDVVEAILGEAAKFSEETLQPLNLSGDHEGCTRHLDGTVSVPKGFKEAFKAYNEGGWMGLSSDSDYGGQGLPYTLQSAVDEYFISSGLSFAIYPSLTQGAIAAIQVHGTNRQKNRWLPKMNAGMWTGTMNLTEPHCGTDLGMLLTKAVAQEDGTYKIAGQKIFISSGEHDMAENIVHLVLARIEGAPQGTKGISLFIVPKFILDKDEKPGKRNDVSCSSIEEKMGIHANSTCVMNYDSATGYLLGEENKGLRAMFTMMNEARLGVGLQGLSLSQAAGQNAVQYAKERLQGRALSGVKAQGKPADPIIEHPDVRRMLMDIRAFNEGGRALVLWTSLKGDISHRSPSESNRQAAREIMGLLTPVIKGVLTDRGFESTVQAQQIYGGHGYIYESGMGQFVRDARITQIYEGANGIQALDLVGRKLPKNGGRAMRAFMEEIFTFIKSHKNDKAMQPYIVPLQSGAENLNDATLWLAQNAITKPDNAGAAATDFMHLMGLVALGYMWTIMADRALAAIKAGNDDKSFYESKLITGRYYMERVMPETNLRLVRIQSGCDSMMALDAEQF